MNKPGQLTAMISSTALDLPEHREQAVRACLSAEIFPIGMEQLPARDAHGIRVSLEMVDQADIYIGIYAMRYGWIPNFDNPAKISVTEMEFNRAVERKNRGELQEILIFLMDDAHPILARDKEDGNAAQKKLKGFKQRASEGRVVAKFKSKEELREEITRSLIAWKARTEPSRSSAPTPASGNPIPKPPIFYAEPDFIVSNRFIGREMSDEFLYDVFLSYSTKDKAVVRAVAERLRADGVRVWFDDWSLKPGDNIPAKLEEGLEHSRVLILCMSVNAFGSDWARLESGTFRFRDPLNNDRRLVPLRLDDAPIRGTLGQFVYIDWRPSDREEEYSKLLEACRPRRTRANPGR